ncbi:MAG: minichromosome maintenance protein MCM [Promethearchaeota archaeon]
MTISPGTQLNRPINKVQRIEDFLRLFQSQPGKYKYQEKINEIYAKGEDTLIILYEDLLSFDYKIAEMLKEDPESLLEASVEAFKNIIKFQAGSNLLTNYFVQIETRDEKSPLSNSIRGLRANNIDELIFIKGIIIRTAEIKPKLKKAIFQCLVCGSEFETIQLTSSIKWPKFCIDKKCKAKRQGDFRIITKKSIFVDWQMITIQEIPEDLPAGRIPISIQGLLKQNLVDIVKPGDRVHIVGIFKAVLTQSIKSLNSTLFNYYIDINFIDSMDKVRETVELTKKDKEIIEKLSKEKNIQKKIAKSIAPHIYGRDNLKLAAALSIFGGVKKRKVGGGYTRGDIHCLFVGDPGTAKSEILKGAIEISPRGIYTSGKGASGVGLTASVIKDPMTGQWSLEGGVVVLANGGIAAIDELDKMEKADRTYLHEGMEQQTISINKAGINATLRSETAILGAANPRSGRYDHYKTPTENINLKPPFMSRFDLIFVVLDKPNPEQDKKLAEFILQNAMRNDDEIVESYINNTSIISIELLKKYVEYAKKHCSPRLTKEASIKIRDFFLELRGKYNSDDAIVSILSRSLEGLVRLSEAYARMALKDKVELEDVEEILKLYMRYLNDTGYDEGSGKIDMDRILVGQSRTKINKIEKLRDKLTEIFKDNNFQALETKVLIEKLELEPEFDINFIDKALNDLVKDGTLYRPRMNKLKLTPNK